MHEADDLDIVCKYVLYVCPNTLNLDAAFRLRKYREAVVGFTRVLDRNYIVKI